MRGLKKRGPHVLDDLMTSYFPYIVTVFLRKSLLIRVMTPPNGLRQQS